MSALPFSHRAFPNILTPFFKGSSEQVSWDVKVSFKPCNFTAVLIYSSWILRMLSRADSSHPSRSLKSVPLPYPVKPPLTCLLHRIDWHQIFAVQNDWKVSNLHLQRDMWGLITRNRDSSGSSLHFRQIGEIAFQLRSCTPHSLQPFLVKRLPVTLWRAQSCHRPGIRAWELEEFALSLSQG